MIYLDNASTTNKKPLSVKLMCLKALSKGYCSNPGRSSHKISLKSANIVFEARSVIQRFFNAESVDKVIFTSGCTEAINTAIFGTIKKGGHIIISNNEHNSVARPLKKLEQDGVIELTILKANKDGKILSSDFLKAIKPNTYMLILNHTSNVTGITQNLDEFGKICNEKGIIFMVDCAQSAGHQKIDMQKQKIDILCSAGHKGLYAMQGVGILIFNNKVEIKPLKLGGTGTFGEQLLPPNVPPESLEAGTSAVPNIFSLKAGIEYVEKHFEKINSKIHSLTKLFYENLQTFSNVIIYTPKDCYNGVISFTIKGHQPSEIESYLNEKNIFVRSGLHCAPLVHERLGTIKNGGTIRVSISHFNKKSDIKKLIKALKKYEE